MSNGWIGVDLDGTLAYYDYWRGPEHIGEPIPAMLERVQRWLAEGKDVRIFTARVERATVALSPANPNSDASQNFSVVEACIRRWCEKHIGRPLPTTCCKDYGMIELWDDRAIQVIPNTGRTIADEFESERMALSGKAALQ
jgi:hypothetical protein